MRELGVKESQYRRGFSAISRLTRPPIGNLPIRELLETSKFRHSSEGWNPVLRLIKHLDGLGPSLRWDECAREGATTARWKSVSG